MIYIVFGSQNQPIPSGAVRVYVGEQQLKGCLTVWPNDEEMPLTDLSCKVTQKCYVPKHDHMPIFYMFGPLFGLHGVPYDLYWSRKGFLLDGLYASSYITTVFHQ